MKSCMLYAVNSTLKPWLLLFLVLYTIQINAVEVKNINGRILLSDTNCSELETESGLLQSWNRSAGEEGYCGSPKSGTDNCVMDITDCVPQQIRKYQGLKAKEKGPNCWNFALVLKGILPAFRMSTPEEMSYYAKPPLCNPVPKSESPKPGDIGLIRNAGEEESHGFIYVSKRLAVSKNSFSLEDPYELQPSAPMLEDYGIPKSEGCNRVNDDEHCSAHLVFVRCKSMQEYLDSTPDLPAQLIKSLHGFDQFESCLSQRMIGGDPLKPAAWNQIKGAVDILATYLKDARRKGDPTTAQEQFLIGALQLRLSGIYDSLSKTSNGQYFDVVDEIAQIRKGEKDPVIPEDAQAIRRLQNLLKQAE